MKVQGAEDGCPQCVGPASVAHPEIADHFTVPLCRTLRSGYLQDCLILSALINLGKDVQGAEDGFPLTEMAESDVWRLV